VLREDPFLIEPDASVLRELSELTRLPDQGAMIARGEIFALEEGPDYTVDEGRAAVLTERAAG
jgi:hypothetical protein